MAGKKGAVIQLQTEVNTDEEWEKLLEKQGLVVVDVYSNWCGPCLGMVGTLKKIKMDIGGDMLHLAIAKSDDIESLRRFRNKSEPTWMFIASGHLVNLMFGANAPRLSKLIINELMKEIAVLKGERERVAVPFGELTPEEKVRFDASEKVRLAEVAEKEAALAKSREIGRQNLIETMMEELKDSTIVIYLPFIYDEEEDTWSAHNRLMEELAPFDIYVKSEAEMEIDYLMASQLFHSGMHEISEECNEQLEAGNCMVKWLEIRRPPPPPESEPTPEGDQSPEVTSLELEPDPLEVVVTAIYGYPPPPVGDSQQIKPDSLFNQFSKSKDIPGMWTPGSWKAKAEAVELLFPKFADQFVESEPEPLPPLMALAFKATVLDDIEDALEEYQDQIIEMGFFDQTSPERMRQVAMTPEDFRNLPHKSGKEKLVLFVNITENDALLSLSQFTPVYISPTAEVGATDYNVFFPPFAEGAFSESLENFPYALMSSDESIEPSKRPPQKAPSKEPSVTTTVTYDPLAYKVEEPQQEEDEMTLASGFEAN